MYNEFTEMTDDLTLSCENITKRYKEKEVLSSINVTFEPGKIYGLLGRNGAGKTTLLSILSAQNPATKGEVFLGNEKVWENANALSHICFSRELNPTSTSGIGAMKVKDYLKTAAIYYSSWDQDMANKLLEEFSINPKDKIMKLSKGMLSSVTIIVALASKCAFTLIDEPVAGLDVFAREKFYKLLIEEFSNSGRTFVVSTHIIEEASNVLEDVIILNHGQIMINENTEALLSRCYHVSGKIEDVDAATNGLTCYHEEIIGRSKGVTVLLEDGQSIKEGYDVSVQQNSLQNAFLALCAK